MSFRRFAGLRGLPLQTIQPKVLTFTTRYPEKALRSALGPGFKCSYTPRPGFG